MEVAQEVSYVGRYKRHLCRNPGIGSLYFDREEILYIYKYIYLNIYKGFS